MQLKKIKGGNYLVDDTYNATPKGFEAALRYLYLFKGKKKIVVTPGIIELGEESGNVHKKIGQLLARFADYIVLTSDDFIDEIREGMGNSRNKLVLIKDSNQIKRLLSENDEKYAILLEGRIPLKVYQVLTLLK